jgi:hypothetical protein
MGVLHGVREFHMEYGSIIWSTGVYDSKCSNTTKSTEYKSL